MQRNRSGYEVPEYDRDDRPTKSARRRTSTRRTSSRQSTFETATKQLARTVMSQLGRALVRGVLGSLKRGR